MISVESTSQELISLTFRCYDEDFIYYICQAMVKNNLFNMKVEYDIEKCTVVGPISEIFIIAVHLPDTSYNFSAN